jgi:hypothetical protein
MFSVKDKEERRSRRRDLRTTNTDERNLRRERERERERGKDRAEGFTATEVLNKCLELLQVKAWRQLLIFGAEAKRLCLY